MFLDRWQYALSEMEGKTYGQNNQGIPVFTYEEVAGMIMGYDPWEIGLQVHQVPAEPVLDKIGIPYDPSAKFKGKDGQELGRPESPSYLKFYSDESLTGATRTQQAEHTMIPTKSVD
jgi:heterodisulfide reductase subunit B